ncbi:hypothetical protein COCOBI_09-2300 [Coccomyxa sp. Obi]|nr:hypothetical protein COCOBI_09-2300 [Coccomyxa sp. Obi]
MICVQAIVVGSKVQGTCLAEHNIPPGVCTAVSLLDQAGSRFWLIVQSLRTVTSRIRNLIFSVAPYVSDRSTPRKSARPRKGDRQRWESLADLSSAQSQWHAY